MGDSITEGWKESRPEFFRGDRIDRGISGQTTSQMLGRFYADVIALRPAVVHILAGTNDIAGNGGATTLKDIENNIRSMVELAQAHRIRVILGTVLPAARYPWRSEIDPVSPVAALNMWIRSYAKLQGIRLVDYYSALDDGHHGLAPGDSGDGVHPSPAGYAKMEAALTAKLRGR
jgi:acyl-CoA thioesterase-1